MDKKPSKTIVHKNDYSLITVYFSMFGGGQESLSKDNLNSELANFVKFNGCDEETAKACLRIGENMLSDRQRCSNCPKKNVGFCAEKTRYRFAIKSEELCDLLQEEKTTLEELQSMNDCDFCFVSQYGQKALAVLAPRKIVEEK